jgi:outer membrane protein assembly factor BamE (lipoprotein component of BamABCDE complex)
MSINLRRRCISLAGLLLAIVAAGCNQQNTRPSDEKTALLSGYSCCNFHYEKDWINDGNYAQLPMIPAGSPIKVIDSGNFRAGVEIDGKRFRLGLDYGRSAESLDQWLAKLVVANDPKITLATYPASVRKAIQSGQVMVGMSKEQVIMSLGYPLTNENPRLDAPLWRYWWSSFGEYQVAWSGGLVSKVTGHPETVALMLAPGNAVTAPASASNKQEPQKTGKTAPAKAKKSVKASQ